MTTPSVSEPADHSSEEVVSSVSALRNTKPMPEIVAGKINGMIIAIHFLNPLAPQISAASSVKEKLKTAISESQRLDVSKAGTYTVASWVRTWYEVYAEPHIRPNTKSYYTNYIENHIIPEIGSIPLTS